jgi:hypothetical protein
VLLVKVIEEKAETVKKFAIRRIELEIKSAIIGSKYNIATWDAKIAGSDAFDESVSVSIGMLVATSVYKAQQGV